MKKSTNFIKQIVALIKGDDAEVKALKIQKQADSACKIELAILEGKTIDLEGKIETAKENLDLARVNYGELIEDRTQYVRNLFIAKNNLIKAENDLVQHLDNLAFLTEQHELI